jgi:hypothetical protein
MPKLTLPDGYSSLLAPDLPDYFDDEKIRALEKRFEIPPELHFHFFNLLDLAARDLLRMKEGRAARLSTKKVAAELEKIRNRSRSLLKLMDEIHPQVFRALSFAEHDIQRRFGEDFPQELLDRKAILPRPGEFGMGWEMQSYSDIEPNLAFIAVVSEMALEHIHSPPRGRPGNPHLDHFARLFCDFWAEDLSKPLTHAAYQGEGLTDADQFVAAILEHISPEDVPSLNTSMEKVISRRRATPRK